MWSGCAAVLYAAVLCFTRFSAFVGPMHVSAFYIDKVSRYSQERIHYSIHAQHHRQTSFQCWKTHKAFDVCSVDAYHAFDLGVRFFSPHECYSWPNHSIFTLHYFHTLGLSCSWTESTLEIVFTNVNKKVRMWGSSHERPLISNNMIFLEVILTI